MYDNDYLEKILGEKYNMSNYFEDTFTNSNVDLFNKDNNINNNKHATKAPPTILTILGLFFIYSFILLIKFFTLSISLHLNLIILNL